jgi:hypothetical protein
MTDNAFRQQRLKAWQPILTPKTVLPLFYAVGLIFALFGGLLVWNDSKVQEIIIDYSQCNTTAPDCGSDGSGLAKLPEDKVSSHFKNTTSPADAAKWCKYRKPVEYGLIQKVSVSTSVCRVQFFLPDDMHPPVLLYYQLTNFYQNHRRYVQSFDQKQLAGEARDNTSIGGSDCDPLKSLEIPVQGGGKVSKPIYPCGLIANSLFNDTFSSPVLLQTGSSANNVTYRMSNNSIAWGSDANLYGQTAYKYGDVVPPPNWALRYPEYNESFPFPKLHEWEEFQVWMRTAGLPTFSKLALRNDADVMKRGTYQIEIYDCMKPLSITFAMYETYADHIKRRLPSQSL